MGSIISVCNGVTGLVRQIVRLRLHPIRVTIMSLQPLSRQRGEGQRRIFLMLASGAEEPVNTLATQVDTPSTSHSPCEDPHTGDVCADVPTAKEVEREISPRADSPTDSSAYTTPAKFQLQLPGFSSLLLARSAAFPAEMGVGSPLMFVSVLAH